MEAVADCTAAATVFTVSKPTKETKKKATVTAKSKQTTLKPTKIQTIEQVKTPSFKYETEDINTWWLNGVEDDDLLHLLVLTGNKIFF